MKRIVPSESHALFYVCKAARTATLKGNPFSGKKNAIVVPVSLEPDFDTRTEHLSDSFLAPRAPRRLGQCCRAGASVSARAPLDEEEGDQHAEGYGRHLFILLKKTGQTVIWSKSGETAALLSAMSGPRRGLTNYRIEREMKSGCNSLQ